MIDRDAQAQAEHEEHDRRVGNPSQAELAAERLTEMYGPPRRTCRWCGGRVLSDFIYWHIAQCESKPQDARADDCPQCGEYVDITDWLSHREKFCTGGTP